MARHTELQIYKPAYDLLSVAVDYVKEMPRSIKPVIGRHVTKLCLELLLLILRANCARDKLPYINTLLERNEELKLLFRLCKDKRLISCDQYAHTIQLTDSIGKQANGWKKSHAT